MFSFTTFFYRCTTLLIMVAVVGSTIPYRQAEAGLLDGLLGIGGSLTGYQETTGQIALQQQRASALSGATAAANTGVSAGMNTLMYEQSSLLDGIAWSVAKQMVAQMTRSLIEWVNSGFQGSPAFVTDINGMLLDTLDQTAGEYIKSLGEVGEFVCSPFRLDVQVALNVAYEKARSGMPSGPSEDMCTLTDIKNNIEGFLDGNVSSWDQWLKVTSNPQNTPYGAYLESQNMLNLRLTNAAGMTLKQWDWGDGFLAMKDCTNVDGSTQQTCTVTTPGKTISDALSRQINGGTDSLIQADEVNELIGALFNQLVLQGVKGLNTLITPGYNGGSGSYLDQAVDTVTPEIDLTPYREEMNVALTREQTFLNLIINASNAAATAIIGTATTSSSTATMQDLLNETSQERTQVNTNIANLNTLINSYDSASTTVANATTTITVYQVQLQTTLDYITLRSDFTTDAYLEQKRTEWNQILYPDGSQTLPNSTTTPGIIVF